MTIVTMTRLRALTGALVVFCCALMLSLAVMPTIIACKSGSNTIVSAPPTEEEHSHGREAGKVNEVIHAEGWGCRMFLLAQRIHAVVRDRGEDLPSYPLRPVQERPPRMA